MLRRWLASGPAPGKQASARGPTSRGTQNSRICTALIFDRILAADAQAVTRALTPVSTNYGVSSRLLAPASSDRRLGALGRGLNRCGERAALRQVERWRPATIEEHEQAIAQVGASSGFAHQVSDRSCLWRTGQFALASSPDSAVGYECL